MPNPTFFAKFKLACFVLFGWTFVTKVEWIGVLGFLHESLIFPDLFRSAFHPGNELIMSFDM